MKTTIKNFVITGALVFSFGSNVFAQWIADPANTTNIYNTNTGKVGIGLIPKPDYTLGLYPTVTSTLQVRGLSGRTSGTSQILLPVVKITSPTNNNSIGFGLENIGYPFLATSFINTEGRLNIYSTELGLAGNVGIGVVPSSTDKLQVGGKVLIGGVRPGAAHSNYSLAVSGLIVTQSLIVTAPSSWADFVFKKSYALADLNAQEKFIQANGHLEGVPSEAEVMNEGYDITKMDANLLRKIEELYLYTIALQKTVDAQKSDIESLKQQLKSNK